MYNDTNADVLHEGILKRTKHKKHSEEAPLAWYNANNASKFQSEVHQIIAYALRLIGILYLQNEG